MQNAFIFRGELSQMFIQETILWRSLFTGEFSKDVYSENNTMAQCIHWINLQNNTQKTIWRSFSVEIIQMPPQTGCKRPLRGDFGW